MYLYFLINIVAVLPFYTSYPHIFFCLFSYDEDAIKVMSGNKLGFTIKKILTFITCVSLQLRRLQKGGMTPQLINAATCSLVPLILRFETAHAASFCVWNSPLLRFSTILGKRPASMTAWTWCLFPAVMFDKNHTASLQIFSFC